MIVRSDVSLSMEGIYFGLVVQIRKTIQKYKKSEHVIKVSYIIKG